MVKRMESNTKLKRSIENGTGVTAGSVFSYQVVELLMDMFPDTFTRLPSLEPIAITVITVGVSIAIGQWFQWRGIGKSEGEA